MKTVDEIIMSKNYLALLFNILMALSRASTAFLKFGTFSADVSGKLGIFWEGGGGTGRGRGGYVVLMIRRV